MAGIASTIVDALSDRYEFGRELGHGGMATVYLARDLKHERPVAFKILRPDLAAVLGPERFLQEIRLAARLQHPHILPVFDSGKTGDLLWYTMPYVEGESLRERLRRKPRFPVQEAMRIAHQVAEALDYSHRHGIVHRDIKPENILLEETHAVVADFGIARAVSNSAGPTLTETGLVLGTPAYMSPEQAMGESTMDGRTDVYALGCVLFEMLAGEPPFKAPTGQAVLARRLTEPVPRISTLREDVATDLEAVITKALARLPGDRYPSAAAFAAALTQPDSARVVRGTPLTTWRRHLAIAALVVGVLMSLALWPRDRERAQPSINPQLVAVLPFRVVGSDSSLHYLRQGMIDLMVAKLTGEGGTRAADARSVLAALRSVADSGDADVPMEAALKVARRVGAGQILQGSVVGPTEHIVITASLVGEPGTPLKQASVEGPTDSLFVLIDRLTAELLALGAGASQQQLSSLTTTSLDALRAYLDGQAAYRRGAFFEATRLLDRSLQLDSTFALAATALFEAGGWSSYRDMARAGRLAWKYRDRLSERDKLLLSTRLGPRHPLWSPATLDIAAREQLTQTIPESPEAWHSLGDALFHFGLLAGIPDARQRAGLMLQRALERDSLFAPALAHLVSLAAERGDSSELKLLVPRLLALDSTDWTAWAARWNLAAARRDEGAMSTIVASLATDHPLHTLNQAFDQLGDSTGLAHLDAFLSAARRRVTTSAERAQYARHAWVHAANLGRPMEARRWADSTGVATPRILAILGWLHGGDTADLDEAGRREERRASARSRTGDLGYTLFLKEAWKLRRKDLSSVERTVHQFRRDPTLAHSVREDHLVTAQILEGWAAVVRKSPHARERVDAADSMLVGRGGFITIEWLNPLVANLYEQLGSRDRALAAIRRRLYNVTFIHPAGLAETSRLEGLWAAQTGDRAGAIRAYRRYLMFRTSPEPSKLPQRDSVRAELAALERESTDR